MNADDWQMMMRLVIALVAGAIIGYERTYHARPAGFRTHALVCMASSLLMLVTVYESHWVTASPDSVRLDPTRMAQGIMTGIGFLGAGVIFREGLSVRGLTTAASIWVTAAIGVLAGIGFYFPLVIAVLLTIGVLSAFRWIESRMPSQAYYHVDVQFERSTTLSEKALRAMIESHGFSIANFSYRLDDEGRVRRHSMVLRTTDQAGASTLSDALVDVHGVRAFRISPTGD
ncbi:MAG: MgtC/SapB family protein [Lautropia sp.]